MDHDDRALMRLVHTYLERVNADAQREAVGTRTPLGDVISEHLGADAVTVAVVQEDVAPHRFVDADAALTSLSDEVDGTLVGITGGEQRYHSSMAELVSNPYTPFSVGALDFVERATGPRTNRRVVAMGLRLLRHEGHPLAVVQRAASPERGRPSAAVEIMGAEPAVVSSFLDIVRRRMVELSVLRGRVLSFSPTEYGQEAGATFVERPTVSADEIVLPEGILDSVVDHVVGIGEHRDVLLAAGQHLKRGVLLYGPPGTGKTLTVRHLLARTEQTTAVLLTGTSIRFVAAAAEIARTFQPSIVVLEDIDLVAMERHMSPQPLLFEVLEALDGLDGDADVAFVMTTNRVEVLERALAERPGRVDLAVEIPLPADAERIRLFRRYAHDLAFSDDVLERAALRSEGTTGSFAKELMRRSVLRAAARGESAGDDDLTAALDELLSARARLTRRLLGAEPDGDAESSDGDDPDESGSFGWFAYSPMN